MSRLDIRRAHIYGFGQWVDYSIDFSKHSFVTIFGENESGKSTIQTFILFMLFGFPPKARKFYRPKTSGKMGGRLVLYDDDIGEFSIERFDEVNQGAATCYDQNGNLYDENWLKQQLNSMTETTFRSIFSFSAIDLTQFKYMKAADLDELLLSVSLTGSNRVYEVEKRLAMQMGELFKPYGKVPIINQQLQLLDDLNAESYELLEHAQTHRRHKVRLEEVMKEIASLEVQLKQAQIELKWIEKKRYALPLIEEERYYLNQLEAFPTHMTFPEDGLDRLQNIKDALVPLKSEISLIQSSLEDMYKKQEAISLKRLSDHTIHEAKNWLKKKEQYIKNEQKLASHEETNQQLLITYRDKLAQLDMNMDESDIDQLNIPFHTEKRWHELRMRHEKLKLEKQQCLQEIKLLQKQRNYLLNQLYEHETQLLDEQVMLELEQRLQQHTTEQYEKNLIAQSKQKRDEWQKTRQKQEKHVMVMLGSYLSISILMGLAAYLFDLRYGYVLALLLSIVGFGQWLRHRQSVKQMERVFTPEISERHDIQIMTEQEQLDVKKRLENHEKIKQKMITLESELKSIESQIISSEEKAFQMNHLEQVLKEDIDKELAAFPFLRQVNVSHWPDVYHYLNQLIGFRRQIKTIEAQTGKLQLEQRIFLKQLHDFMEHRLAIDIEEDGMVNPHDYANYFDRLEQIIQHQLELQQMDQQLKAQIDKDLDRQKALQEAIQVYKQDMATLFSLAEVDHEEAFYKKAKAYQIKQDLEQKKQSISVQLAAIFTESQLEQLQFEGMDEKEIELEYESIIKKIDDIEQRITEKRQEAADLKAVITSLESSEVYSNKLHEIELERAELQKLAKRWAVLKTAEEILKKTKRHYRQKYLTKIMAITSHFFGHITDGKYKKVLPPTEDRGFQIVSYDDMIYEVSELSQGTVDQLYMSLRFALSQTMSEQFKLPLLIDDAFVHADLSRTTRIVSILKEIAKHQQVILLTCKPYILNEIPEAHTITLANVPHSV